MSITQAHGWNALYKSQVGGRFTKPVVLWESRSGERPVGYVLTEVNVGELVPVDYVDHFGNKFVGYTPTGDEDLNFILTERDEPNTKLVVELSTGRRFVGTYAFHAQMAEGFIRFNVDDESANIIDVRAKDIISIACEEKVDHIDT